MLVDLEVFYLGHLKNFYTIQYNTIVYRFCRSVGHALDEIIAVRQQIFRRQVVRMGQNLARWYSPTLLYTHAIAEVGERWLMRSPWGAKILQGVNNFCLAKRDEI